MLSIGSLSNTTRHKSLTGPSSIAYENRRDGLGAGGQERERVRTLAFVYWKEQSAESVIGRKMPEFVLSHHPPPVSVGNLCGHGRLPAV